MQVSAALCVKGSSMEYLGEPRELIYWLSQEEFPADGWLYIKADVDSIKSDTKCWPVIIESRDLSDEEFEEMELWLEANGYNSFLCKDQLVDILSNLEQQIDNPNAGLIIKAIQYYWERDACICL